MNKEFIPYEQALALKELGFDETCFGYYGENQELIWKSGYAPWVNSERNLVDNHFVTTPLYQQAFRWFREKYKLDNWVYCSDENKGYFAIIVSHRRLVIYNEIKNTYEEAELACLNKLIEIIKKK